ncbi:MAG: recombinase family protein [Pseudonocardiales bacterium]|nr:recombinase family protein [Pseudonocardiales bacterium]MBV9652734.1 recombinase family protein [Pseudonocardiales bacterium]
MTIYAYVRISTVEQGKARLVLAAQRRKIEEHAQAGGWGALEWAIDDSCSSKNVDRPSLTGVLHRITAGDRLVVANFDRLSQSVLDFAHLLKGSTDEAWSVVIVELHLDTATASGQFVVTVLAALAQLEWTLISERPSAARQTTNSRRKRPAVGNPQISSDILARIVTLRRSGMPVAAIADLLNSSAVATPRGGGRWYLSTVRLALRGH